MEYRIFWEAGFRVFGLYGRGKDGKCECGNPKCPEKSLFKHPRVANWQHTPHWSEEQLETLELMKHLRTGYGVALHEMVVVDVDARNGGLASLAKLLDVVPEIAGSGLIVNTGSGGGSKHYYFKAPPGVALVIKLADYPGLDFKSGQFWQSNSFAALPQARRYAQERQELFWLQLLDLLHNRREAEAQEMLKFNRFRTRSWQPDLEAAVRRILIYRQARSLNAADLVFVSTTPATNQHQFFVQLESLAKQERSVAQFRFPPEFDALLRGPEAFAAAFLAAGWREAALQLYAGTDLSQRPDWLAYGLGQLLRMNRGNRAALTFLDKQKPSPSLGLLSAEILIGDGKAAEGLKRLATLASENSPVGFRASYMLALASLDAGKYDDARGWVSRQPLLVKEIVGVELLARIALRQGQAAEADRLYRTVAKDSIEAKSYLARQAFAQKNWAEARRYTMELIHALPDELTLRENLLAIDKAAATP